MERDLCLELQRPVSEQVLPWHGYMEVRAGPTLPVAQHYCFGEPQPSSLCQHEDTRGITRKGREGNQPGDAGHLSQQLVFQLTACIKPWPLAISILGLYFIQQQEGLASANIHISGFFCSFFCA